MVTLPGRERAAFHEKSPRMAFQDLHGAVGPAEALLFEIDESVLHETAPITRGHIGRLEAGFENTQPQLGILGNTPLCPPGLVELCPPDHRHGAVLNDGVALVARDHSNVKEPTVFRVAHRLESARALVAIVLRPLDDSDTRVLEPGYQLTQPVRLDDVITVDDRDDLRIGSGTRQGEVQGAGFEALQ